MLSSQKTKHQELVILTYKIDYIPVNKLMEAFGVTLYFVAIYLLIPNSV